MANNGRSKYILKYQGGAKIQVNKDINVSFSELQSVPIRTGIVFTKSDGRVQNRLGEIFRTYLVPIATWKALLLKNRIGVLLSFACS